MNYAETMREVSKDEFYKAIGPKNVGPTIVNNWEAQGRGYVQEWKLLGTRTIIGMTESGAQPFTEPKYFLAVTA